MTDTSFSLSLRLSFSLSLSQDALLQPLCEKGEVNNMINELLVHMGLIKVSLRYSLFNG